MVCALQIKSQELFDEWVSKLRHHRLSRQNEIAAYTNEKSFHYPQYPSPNSPSLAESASIRKVIMSSAWRKNKCPLCLCRSCFDRYWGWLLGVFAIAVHVYTKAVHGAFCGRLPFELQQPGQSSSLAPVIRRHGQVLQRWDNTDTWTAWW